jgi:hypothetical protein
MRKLREWRDFMTPDERLQVEPLEDRLRELDAERRKIRAEIDPIRTRCAKRGVRGEEGT